MCLGGSREVKSRKKKGESKGRSKEGLFSLEEEKIAGSCCV